MHFYIHKAANDIDEFVEVYSPMYFLDNPNTTIIKKQFKTNRDVENIMEDILKNGIKDEKDVVRILAWKIGAIDHEECEKRRKKEREKFQGICYKENFKDPEDFKSTSHKTRVRGGEIDVKGVAKYIVQNLSELEKMPPDKVLDELMKFKRIGPVYAMTLLFFLTRGKYPIYDQFAKRAADAIEHDLEPQTVPYKEPPKDGKKVLNNFLLPYIQQLNTIFPKDEYMNNRNIDRALWVYGHLFN